ncbi:MAG: hypothetical protein ACRDT0_09290 [Pseudonocardiaceae bacterium]
MSTVPPREEDVLRHVADLVSRSYEGAESWPDRLALFHQAVELIDPLVRRVLDETDATFLEATGETTARTVEHDDGSVAAHWELSWPRQREATSRDGGPVAPIQVIAWFRRSFNHPHLRGSTAGDWPLQVLTADDAARQEPIVRAIVEAELHQRIFEGRWPVVPAAVRKHGPPSE